METIIDVDKEFLTIQGNLKSFLYRLSANKPDTEDILHDTYIKAKEKIGTFRGESSFKTWVFTIATNLAKDKQRVQNRWGLDAQDKCKELTVSNKSCENRMVSAYQNQKIKTFDIAEHINYCFTCIAKNLTLEKQVAIILKEFYNFKRLEIAQILGITEGVVKHLLHGARNELQTRYEHRCAMINKNGICYQCAELYDYFQNSNKSDEKIHQYGFLPENNMNLNLNIRFKLINKINPLENNGADLEDIILQILQEAIEDK